MRVLRIYHSAVVTDWRARDRWMRSLGVDLTLVSPRRWDEGGRVVELRREEGADDFVVSTRTLGRHPYGFVYGPVGLFRAMTRGLDVVDLHEEPGSLAALEVLVLRRLARASATPLVFYSAQNIFKRYPRPFRWIERLALKTASGAYVCNLDAKSVLERKGFGGLIEVIPLGVDPDLFRPSSSPGATAAPLTVGYAGRLEEHKGVSVLLRAIGILEDVELRIVGDGSEAANLMSLAAELGIAGRVSFERFAGRESMADFYRSIDLLAVPSLVRPNWVEQFGRVAAEAMAAGTPIVAAASGSLPEVVGNAGILVAPEDPSALAAAIDSLQDAGRRQELAAAAALRGRTFAWGEVARAHLGLYQAVARPRVASPHTS